MDNFECVDYASWLTQEYKNVLLRPEIRIQADFKDCTHCAFCPAIEVRNQKIWLDDKEYDSNKHHRVDIEQLKLDHPPPQSALVMIDTIKKKFFGLIKATALNDPWPFKVKGCHVYSVYHGAPEQHSSIQLVITHVKFEGPVLGCFRVCDNYSRITTNELYIGSGRRVYMDPPHNKQELIHTVCIIGIVTLKKDDVYYLAFEILEGGKLIDDDKRLRYIWVPEIDYVYVPLR